MTTNAVCANGITPRSKLMHGDPVHDPDAALIECARVTYVMRAVLWYDAGEAAWREATRHQSRTLRRPIWMAQN